MVVTVTAPHENRYPKPLQAVKGSFVLVDVAYSSSAEQDQWMFCRDDKSGIEGWIHESFLSMQGQGEAMLKADFSARELSVQSGDSIHFFRAVGGWGWCMAEKDGLAGWLPMECVPSPA